MSEKYIQELLSLARKSLYLLAGLFLIFLAVSPFLVRVFVKGSRYYLFGVADTFEFFFSIAAKLALLVWVPIVVVWVYTWASDALLPEEKQWIKQVGVVSVLLFFVGAIVGALLFPRVMGIVQWIAALYGANLLISMRELVDFALTMVVLTGIAFQFPVVMYFLIRLGIVQKKVFCENRHVAYMFFLVLSMLITPGDMLFTDLILTLLFVLLYESTLAIARRKA